MTHSTLELQAPHTIQLDVHSAPVSNRGRLVVIFQHVEDEALLASQILDLAQARGLGIFLLGIASDASQAAEMRRGLVTVAAFIREEQSRMAPMLAGQLAGSAPEIVVETGKGWINRLRTLLREEDLVACYSQSNVGFL